MAIVPIKWNYWGTALIAVVLLAISTWTQAAGQKKTLTGTVSDVMCGAKHMMTDVTAAECTNKCVGMGTKYALVVGSQVYELNSKTERLDKLAGKKAKISGTVDGNKVQVESVSPAS